MYLIALTMMLFADQVRAQQSYGDKIKALKALKEAITEQERTALKMEVEEINRRLTDKQITIETAQDLKEKAAKKRALNIEDRIAIINSRIALLERNEGRVMEVTEKDSTKLAWTLALGLTGADGTQLIGNEEKKWKRELKYDRRTYSDAVFAFGLNNAIIEGQSLEDTPYRVGGSRFVELGWNWRTRVFKNTNIMRINYGFSFQFNGLKPKDNQFFAVTDEAVSLEDFEFDLDKSKFRMDNLVFPIHLEIGPSKVVKSDERIRYMIDRKFRIGIGGYGGINLGTRQKLKYTRNGERVKEKQKRNYNTPDFVYGLSAYMGVGGVQLYAKYDLNAIFQGADVEQRNVSLGLRFDL